MSIYIYRLSGHTRQLEEGKFYGVQFFQNAFTRDECARIRDICRGIVPVAGKTSSLYLHRISTVRWLGINEDSTWIYQRLAKIVLVANSRYRFRLSGFREPLQHSTYEPGGALGYHTDLGEDGGRFRKLSFTIQISEEDGYSGGELMFPSIERGSPPKKIGTVIVFPAFLVHEVTEIQVGIRESLAGWVCGPAFV